MSPLITLLGGIALTGLGAAGLVETVLDLRRCRAAKQWPSTEGRITGNRIKGSGKYQDDYTERLILAYTFMVNDTVYTGHRIRAGQELDLTLAGRPGTAWSTGRHDACHYPPGAPVRVYYDPKDPSRCCLQQGGLPGICLKLIFCLALLVLGVSTGYRSLQEYVTL